MYSKTTGKRMTRILNKPSTPVVWELQCRDKKYQLVWNLMTSSSATRMIFSSSSASRCSAVSGRFAGSKARRSANLDHDEDDVEGRLLFLPLLFRNWPSLKKSTRSSSDPSKAMEMPVVLKDSVTILAETEDQASKIHRNTTSTAGWDGERPGRTRVGGRSG